MVTGQDSTEVSATGAVGRSLPSWVAPVVLALVGGVVPIAVAWHFGALGIPRNDDWSYVLSAFRFADSGTLDGNGWNGKNLVGQFVLSVPVVRLFGHRIAALQLTVAVFGVVGLVAAFDLARQVLSPRRALFVATMVAVGPMWASLSASYMSDTPAFALAMVCLALGARAVRADDLDSVLFGVAVVVGFVAFTVREFAIVAPVAVCVAALWTAGRWPRPRVRGVSAALVSLGGAAALFWLWRRGLANWGQGEVATQRPSPGTVSTAAHQSVHSAVLLGLLVAPALLLAGPVGLVKRSWSRAPRTSFALGVMTISILGGDLVWDRESATLLGNGNYVLPNGTLGTFTISGTRPDLFADPVLALLTLVGALALLLLVLTAVPPTIEAVGRVRRGHLGSPASPALVVVTLGAVGFGLTCTLPAVIGPTVFDRYLLPLIPLVAILALHAGGLPEARAGSVRVVGGAALVVFAVFGAVYAMNSASFDGTKWRVAEQAAEFAGSSERVEGGFEWTSYHAGTVMPKHVREAMDYCVVLRAETRPSGDGRDVRVARVWGPTGRRGWIVARQRHAC